MATSNASLASAVRKGVVRSRSFRAHPGLPSSQPRNGDSIQAIVTEQLPFDAAAALLRKAGAPIVVRCSGAFQQAGRGFSVNALGAVLLSGIQIKLLKSATAVIGDVVAGRAAAPSLRLLTRRALRAAAMAACATSFAVKIWALAGSLAHIDSAHGLAAEAELANAVCTLLSPTVGPASPPLLRAVGPASALAADLLDTGVAVEELERLDAAHPDLATGAGKAQDLVLACVGVAESCQELSRIARAGRRSASGYDGGNGRGGKKH